MMNNTYRNISKLLAFLLFLVPTIIISQDNQTCLDCHSERDMTMEKHGKEVSIYVNAFVLKHSVHGKLKCVDCHVGFDPDAFPHKDPMTSVNCVSCHKDFAQKHPFHPQLKNWDKKTITGDVDCKSCHGTHNVQPQEQTSTPSLLAKTSEMCGKCHEKEKTDFLQSVHALKGPKTENAPNCLYCHQFPVTPRSIGNKDDKRKAIQKLCSDCHSSQGRLANYTDKHINIDVSIHGLARKNNVKEAANCVNCHSFHKIQMGDQPTSTLSKLNYYKNCIDCHKDNTNEFLNSIHGKALLKNIAEAPNCFDCHVEHNFKKLPDLSESQLLKMGLHFDVVSKNRMIFCVSCHQDSLKMAKFNLKTIENAHKWLPNKEAHWKKVRCVDCHSSYEPPNKSHFILPKAQTLKNCVQCHRKNSILLTKLYVHESKKAKSKYGFINGAILNDSYVIGSTRNQYLDKLSIILGLLVVGFIAIHGLFRWLSNKSRKH